MASSNTIQVASVTSTRTFGKTDAEVAQVLRWFLVDKTGPPPEGMTVAQTNKWYLDQTNDAIVNYVKREARMNRLRELQSTGTLEAQADNDTNL